MKEEGEEGKREKTALLTSSGWLCMASQEVFKLFDVPAAPDPLPFSPPNRGLHLEVWINTWR
jgi:hypothetical protein